MQTIFDDAYRYIRNSTESFDAIYLDFPMPNDYNLSKLYSREFFHFVRQRLAPSGFVVLDAPGLKGRANVREIYTSTIKTAGFEHVRPYISEIEEFNREAARLLVRSGYVRNEAQSLMISHARSLRHGFVLARNDVPEVPFYREPDLKLHVLTEERLIATLQGTMPPTNPPDPRKVNSIFRPTLPDGRIWKIRNAW